MGKLALKKNESYRVRTVCKEDALKKGEKREEGGKRKGEKGSVGIYVFVLKWVTDTLIKLKAM